MNKPSDALSLSLRLKEATHTIHEDLDKSIMAQGLFSGTDRYRNFVKLQYQFHRDINALYHHIQLIEIIPDLSARNRYAQICLDMGDLDLSLASTPKPLDAEEASSAIGWLYVAEGSKLGANFLIKLAEKIGFNETFGARHLAADSGGRGSSWNAFKSAIDHAGFDPALAAEGAQAAFLRVKSYLLAANDKHNALA